MLALPGQTRRGRARVGGRADRPRARARVGLPARALSRTRRSATRWRAELVAAPDDDDAADMYLETMDAAGVGRLRAVRDLERRAPRPPVAPQRQILDRRRVAWLRLRGALDSGSRAVEQYRERPRVRGEDGARGVARVGPPPVVAAASSSRRRCSWRCAWPTACSFDRIRTRYGVDVWQEWGERLAPFEEAGLLERDDRRLRLTRRGHAPGQQRNDHFSRSRQYGKVTARPTRIVMEA